MDFSQQIRENNNNFDRFREKQHVLDRQVQARASLDAMEAQARQVSGHMARTSAVDPRRSQASRKNLDDLSVIKIKQLGIDKVHKNKVLKGTVIGPACKSTAVMISIQDDEDENAAILVAIYNKLPADAKNRQAQLAFPEGAHLAIKEPYCKKFVDGSLGIRVDFPSDVVLLSPTPQARATSTSTSSKVAKKVENLRTSAGDLFRAKEYAAALTLYLQCAELEVNNAVHFNNVAAVHLATEHFESAFKAASHSLTLLKLEKNLKAAYRKAKAMIGLRCYAGAVEVLEKIKKVDPSDVGIACALKEAKMLAAHAATGSYDLMAIFDGKLKTVGDYIGPVKIFKSPIGGRGVCITNKVLPGDLLFVENPLISIPNAIPQANLDIATGGAVDSEAHAILLAHLKDHCSKSKVFARRINALYDGKTPLEDLPIPEMHNLIAPFKTEDDLNSVLKIHKAEIAPPNMNKIYGGVINSNAVGCRGGDDTEEDRVFHLESENIEASLYVLKSFINHSCASNASCLKIPGSGATIVRAAVELQPGDEIFIPYIEVDTLLTERRKFLHAGWKFTCKCQRCIAEEALPAQLTSAMSQLARASDFHTGVTAQLHQPLDLSDVHQMKALFLALSPRIDEFEQALIAANLPTAMQQNWVRASVLTAYLLKKSSAVFDRSIFTQVLMTNLKIRKSIYPGHHLTVADAVQCSLESDGVTTGKMNELMLETIAERYGSEFPKQQLASLAPRIHDNTIGARMSATRAVQDLARCRQAEKAA